MPRPQNKAQLLELSQNNFEKLLQLVNELPNFDFPHETLNRNIADVLFHLHHWHLMLLHWYEEGLKGKKAAIPAEGYTWKTLPSLNKKIWEEYKNQNLEIAKKKVNSSHQAVMSIIEEKSNDELFEKKRLIWTGSTSLAAYLISATSSHYDWAFKLIKKSANATNNFIKQ